MDNIRRLAVFADRRPVGSGNAYTPVGAALLSVEE